MNYLDSHLLKNKLSFNIYNNDCFDILKDIPNNSINLIVTDPPYGIGFTGEHSTDKDWDTFSDKDYCSFLVKLLLEIKRVLTDNGTCWLFCGPTKILDVFKCIEQVKLINNLNNWKSIQRQKGRGAKFKPKSLREDILHITKTNNYVWNNISDIFNTNVTITNVLDLTKGKVIRPKFNINDKIFYFKMPYYLSTTEKMIHSCQKSILLQYALIMNSSNEKDAVLDMFSGSGSSAIATLLAKRNFIGCEKDDAMYVTSNKWINSFDYISYCYEFLYKVGFSFGSNK